MFNNKSGAFIEACDISIFGKEIFFDLIYIISCPKMVIVELKLMVT